MATITSVMHQLFGKAPVQNIQAQPAVAPNQPNAQNNPAKMGEPQIQTNVTPGTAPNGTVPAGANEPPPSPVVDYAKLWETTPVDPNAPKPNVGPSPEDIMKAATKVDFGKILDKEKLEILSKGGEGSAEALVALLNQASQASYGQSAVTASKLVADALKQARAQMAIEVPLTLKQEGAKDTLFAENPGFNDPAVKPIVEAVVAQLAEKFPKASQTELTAHAKRMLQGTAAVLSPQKDETQEAKDDPNEDWSRYLEGAESQVFAKR